MIIRDIESIKILSEMFLKASADYKKAKDEIVKRKKSRDSNYRYLFNLYMDSGLCKYMTSRLYGINESYYSIISEIMSLYNDKSGKFICTTPRSAESTKDIIKSLETRSRFAMNIHNIFSAMRTPKIHNSEIVVFVKDADVENRPLCTKCIYDNNMKSGPLCLAPKGVDECTVECGRWLTINDALEALVEGRELW